MDQFVIKVLNTQIDNVKRIKKVERNILSYEYRGAICYTEIPNEDKKDNFIEAARAIIKRDIANYDVFCVSKNKEGQIEWIAKTIKYKEKQYLKENSKKYLGIQISEIIHKMINHYKKENRKEGTDFESIYKYCLENFRAAMGDIVKDNEEQNRETYQRFITGQKMAAKIQMQMLQAQTEIMDQSKRYKYSKEQLKITHNQNSNAVSIKDWLRKKMNLN